MFENDDVSRRELIRQLGIALVAAGPGALSVEAAQHVHHAVAEEKKSGPYKPKWFNAHEYRTLERLCDHVIPADDRSKGALQAGAPAFIDLLASQNDELAAIYTGGLAWVDREIERRHGARFVEATPARQTALLDLIAYRKNDSPELGPGIRFFDWVRKMTVDAYYTSQVGIEELGYQGNQGMTEFKVPAEAVGYALKRSGLR